MLLSGCGGAGGEGRGADPGTEGAASGSGSPGAGEAAAGEPSRRPLRFVDVTAASGIDFVHGNGATPERLLPETMGSGLAFFDYDRDGHPDVYFVNGAPILGDRSAVPGGALYRNRGDGTFREVTREAGLGAPMVGLGAAVGDVDGDGWLDLFVSGLGEDRLYLNRAAGEGSAAEGTHRRFVDASERWGLAAGQGGDGGGDGGFSASAAFLDADRDGDLDLYVTRYVTWSPQTDVRCSPDGVHRTYCTPEVYEGAPNRYYENRGDRFRDATREAGLWRPEGKSLGVVAFDHDRDGWPDLAVANDTSRNALYRNLGRGPAPAGEGGGGGDTGGTGPWRGFEEIGVEAGIAYSESGATRGGMGIDAGDVDGDGRADVAIGNFAQEMSALYAARGGGLYVDDAAQRGIGLPTVLGLAFGTLLFDQDGDGRLDLALVNGHIEPEIARTRPLHRYAQRPQLFLNRGEGSAGEQFVPWDPPEADAFAADYVARGLAAADLDGDGDLDLGLTQNGGPARILRNEADPQRWLRVRLVGRSSNPQGYGAVVRLVAGERSWRRELVSGRSYLSASEPVLTFGLGGLEAGERVDRLEIEWPSGRLQVVEEPATERLLTVEEPTD